jgi:hypothetical protein
MGTGSLSSCSQKPSAGPYKTDPDESSPKLQPPPTAPLISFVMVQQPSEL